MKMSLIYIGVLSGLYANFHDAKFVTEANKNKEEKAIEHYEDCIKKNVLKIIEKFKSE